MLKHCRWLGESKCQPQPGKQSKSSKRSDRTLIRLSLADRKLTSKELGIELKDSTGVELSATTMRKRLLEMVFEDATLKRTHC